VKRNPRQPLDPKHARRAGSDRDGTAWIDGNDPGIKSQAATPAYRQGWERVFGQSGNIANLAR